MAQALLGRDAEIRSLAGLLDRSAEGELTVALVEGDAGIGKSRLLAEAGTLARDRGGLVLNGSAPPPAGQPLPFAAVSQLLRDALRRIPDDEARSVIADTPMLGHIQLAWRSPGGEAPPVTSLTALCEQLADMLDRLARDRPLVAVLMDDLQWADSATLDLLSSISREPRDTRITLLLAARTDETVTNAPLRAFRADLLRRGAMDVRLAPLGEAAARGVIKAVAPKLDTARLRAIEVLAAGNPLFLSELASETDSGDLPESLVALASNRLAAITEGERTVVRVLSMAADGLPGEVIARVIGDQAGQTLADVRRLVQARILTEDAEGNLTIAQPVVRQVVYEELLDAERRRIHGLIARTLAAEPDLDPRPDAERLVRLANHWTSAGDRMRALPALTKAAEAAERGFAIATAFRLYRAALDTIGIDTGPVQEERRLGFGQPVSPSATGGGPGPGSGFTDLRRRAADTATLAGEPEVALRWIDAALGDATSDVERHQLGSARARALLAAGDIPNAVTTYRAAVDGDPSGNADIGLARALLASGDASEALGVATTALRAARARRSKTDEASALVVLGTALAATGQVEEGMRRIDEARSVRLAQSSQSIVMPRVSRVMDLAGGLADAARLARGAGRTTDAQALADDAVNAATRFGADAEAAQLRLATAIDAFQAGRWAECLAIVDEHADSRPVRVAALTLRARVAALRGAWELAATDLAMCEGPELLRARPADRVRFGVALTELRSGRRQTAAAIESATEAIALAAGALGDDRVELLAVSVRVHVDGALAERATRSATEAAQLAALARALADDAEQSASPRPAAQALLETTRAELSRLGSDRGGAWASARAAWEPTGQPWWQAYAATREAEAGLASTAGRAGAREALRVARSIAQELEAAPLLAEIEALAARARIELEDSVAAPPEEPRRAGALPISERELEVLLLVGKGRTNREIAAELFISERTAAHHVSHIFDKLGVSSRVEAAGIAHQAGLLDSAASD